MKRLKTILKYNKLILILVIIYSLLFTNYLDYKSNYKNEKYIKGYVLEKKVKNNKTILIVKGKEKVLVTIYDELNINYHDYIMVFGKLEEPKQNTIFNLFNYKKYLKEKRINYTFKGYKIKILKRNRNVFYSFKNIVNNRINKYKSKKYLKVFIMGNKDDIDGNIKDVYKNLGIIHLLSISGSYISILIYILNRIIKNKKIISIILIIYIVFTNFQISIIRSSLCYILFLLNKYFKTNIDKKTIILLLGSLLLLFNPYYLYDIGFLLSFLISYSLIHFSYLLENKNYIIKSILISSISFFISLPIIINSYFSINFFSILFNLIYVPISCFIIYPLSLVTMFIPIIDNILFLVINIFEKVSIFLNRIDFLTLSFSKIPFILYFIYYYLIFKKNNKFLLLIFIFYFYNYYLIFPRVYILDVGQADASLVRYKNKNIIIDTGGNYNYDNSDNLVLFYKSIGIKKIDNMIITHGDLDHIGNAYNITKKIKVDNIYINKYDMTDLEKELCRKKCKKVGEDNIINKKFFILNPRYDLNDENVNSLVIYFKLKNKELLFMGDSNKEVEYRLIEEYDLGEINILKVGHHGSRTSSSREFIDEIKPKYSIISVGKNNRYGHPNKEVLDNLKKSKIYRTDQDGSIMFKIKNTKLIVETCSP